VLPAELADWWRAARREPAPASLDLRRGGARLRLQLLSDDDEHLILLSEREGAPSPAAIARCLPVTPREAEVLSLLAAGHTNDGIAHELAISRHTVVRHVERLYVKLGVQTRVAATRAALDALAEFPS
jgi:DNA-binding NarL/FixJ family response regulator